MTEVFRWEEPLHLNMSSFENQSLEKYLQIALITAADICSCAGHLHLHASSGGGERTDVRELAAVG